MKLGAIGLACAAAFCAATWASAEVEDEGTFELSAATIEEAAWLAGRWVGEGLGGQVEETWAPPAGGAMVGHFRLVVDGAVEFYEIMVMDVVAAGVRMRVKHFDPDFVGWEEKDGWHEFEPVAASEDALEFSGLTVRRTGEDTAEFVVRIQYDDGVRDEVIRVARAPM